MIRYATIDDLKRIGGEVSADERRRLVTAAQQRQVAGSTFLSHSSRDTEVLPAVIRVLENHGASVYVDKKDESLPPYTSRETAQILRTRIIQCSKFVLFATKNSKDSKWVPWELGVSDGYKRPSNVAVFPGVDAVWETSWTEQEYLGIYDRIIWGDLNPYPQPLWMVLNQEDNTAIPLSDWLRR